MKQSVTVLKLAYLLGAIADFLAFLMMVFPPLANAFWGFESFSDQYYFAMGNGAPLMLAWTILLLWAYKKPVERRFVAPLTILIVVGIAITNIIMVTRGLFTVTGMLPSFIIQTILLLLLSVGYVFTQPKKLCETGNHTKDNSYSEISSR
ncbi:MAG: hypothetical protein PVH73_02710 [Candidatus Bathyarchaeota archaeon]|jgi:hypothetical protein